MEQVNPDSYTKIPYTYYDTLEEKLEALLAGEVLVLKSYERTSNADVLIRLNREKFDVVQISHDMTENEGDPRYWITFNVGFNDLSLFTAIKFEEELPVYKHKFKINDIVQYTSVDGRQDSAVVREVYVSTEDPRYFAYTLTRDEGLYAEGDLIGNPYS